MIPTNMLDPRMIEKLIKELEEEEERADVKIYYKNMAYALKFVLGSEEMLLGHKREDYVTFAEETTETN